MKQTTIEKIKDNASCGHNTIIGKYTYKINFDGDITRCKTEDIGRMWIDWDGNQYDTWEIVDK